MIEIDDISLENQPAQGSSPGWPLVLYFHHVHPELKHYTSITPDDLRMGLDLVLERFDALDPQKLFQPVSGGNQCLFTFDDGYADNYTYAAPLLAERGIKAVFFGIAGRMGSRSATSVRENYLTLSEYQSLREDGHYIGAHTVSHRRLDTLPESDARVEVSESLAWANQFHDGSSKLFAFPFGAIPDTEVIPDGVLGFGTVRCAPKPWDTHPHQIRRTYLPAGHPELWKSLIEAWGHNE